MKSRKEQAISWGGKKRRSRPAPARPNPITVAHRLPVTDLLRRPVRGTALAQFLVPVLRASPEDQRREPATSPITRGTPHVSRGPRLVTLRSPPNARSAPTKRTGQSRDPPGAYNESVVELSLDCSLHSAALVRVFNVPGGSCSPDRTAGDVVHP